MAKYTISMDGVEEDFQARDDEAARRYARRWIRAGDWHVEDGTIWVSAYLDGPDFEAERIKVAIDPPEPRCTWDEHDWRRPYELVGGLEENPGVWGHGGGVVVASVCMTCGCGRHVDTWAQDMSDGEQGLESVRYKEGEFASEIAWRRREVDREQIEQAASLGACREALAWLLRGTRTLGELADRSPEWLSWAVRHEIVEVGRGA